MRNVVFGLMIVGIIGCNPKILKFGYLPGGKYLIYQTSSDIDFNGHAFDIVFYDMRDSNKGLLCSDLLPDDDFELEGNIGFNFFKQYCTEAIETSNGRISENGEKVIISLDVLSSRLIGIGYIKIHGLCQISVESELITKTYCVDIKDGDKNAPLKWYSLTTRKSGLRKMTSAAIKECIELMLNDYCYSLNIKST